MHELWGSDLAPLIFVAFFGAVTVLTFPIVQGIRRRLEGSGGADARALAEEVRRLRDEVARLQAEGDHGLAERLLEIEERVDFTERLLARGSDAQEG